MLLYLRELFTQVVSALMRNKLRSFLTMAGIAWGVASMVLIVAMGDGFKTGQRDRFKQLGENIVILFPGRTELQAGGLRAGRRIRLNYDDVRDIHTECFRVRDIVAELQSRLRFLDKVGLSYLSLDRAADTLSGGELQRVRHEPESRTDFTVGFSADRLVRRWVVTVSSRIPGMNQVMRLPSFNLARFSGTNHSSKRKRLMEEGRSGWPISRMLVGAR